MAHTQFLAFEINLTDQAQVLTLQGASHAAVGSARAVGAVVVAPDEAAVTYHAPLLNGPAQPFVAPCITSAWFTGGTHYPTNVASFTRKTGGFWAWVGGLFGFGGNTTTYYWRGSFVYSPPVAPGGSGGTVPANIAQRRWIDGFELPPDGEGGSGTATEQQCSRHASRHVQGFGLAMRSSVTTRTHTTVENGAAAPASSWERFYVRVRAAPAAATTLWASHGSVEALSGLTLQITPTGSIAVNRANNVGTLALLGTVAIPGGLHTWARIDILLSFGTGARVIVYVNGVSALDVTFETTGAAGIAIAGRTHVNSVIGDTGANTLACDVDDWMCADQPTNLLGLDWTTGSAMVVVSATGLAASNLNWSGDWRAALQNPTESAAALTKLTTTTAGARLAVTTDAALTLDAMPNGTGVVAMIVAAFNQTPGGNGTLGWTMNGVDTLAAIVQAGVLSWQHVMYRPVLGQTPVDVTPLELVHVKGSGAGASDVAGLCAVAEVLGVFGAEDIVATGAAKPTTIPLPLGPHNAPYPRSPWALKTTAPQSPVMIKSGSYVGNDVGQDLIFDAPVAFFWVRPVTGDTGGTKWWTSLLGAHTSGSQSHQTNLMPQACADPSFAPAGEDTLQQRYLLRISGNSTQNNAVGVTYQYIAFCDPGMRFLINGALTNPKGTADQATSLVHPSFTPQAGFFWQEVVGATGTVRLYYKGPGHASASLSPLSAAEQTSSLIFTGPGVISSQSALHLAVCNQIAFAVFRKDDHSGDAGVPRVVQLGSYVGDGNASRTIALSPASARRPLWAIVVPHNGAAIMRDAGHTGTTSTLLPSTANAATGIVGGDIDTLLIGIALNANGITYDLFVFPGDTTPGNGGWSPPGTFVPVEPDTPNVADGPGPWAPEPPDAPPDSGTGTPGTGPSSGSGDLTNDLSTDCADATQRLCNIALSKAGVTQQITDLSTEVTVEAVTARLHYAEEVEATLRAFPWPFATRYATLTLVAGTSSVAANGDWQYAYRAPTGALFSRRIINPAGQKRGYDPDPIKFRIGSDTTGPLIYSDEAGLTPSAPSVVLEYTFRPPCPAGTGDALFRTALVWRLTAAFAAALARDDKKAAFALTMFDRTIIQAERAAANEGQPNKQDQDADWITGRE